MDTDQAKGSECPDIDLLLDGLDSAVVVMEPDWTIRSCSRRFLELLGREGEDLQGMRMPSLVADPGFDFLALARARLVEANVAEGKCSLTRRGGAVQLDFRVTRLSGPGWDRSLLVTFSNSLAKTGGGERAASLARLSDENPSPVLRISGDGVLLYANRGSWLVQSHWNAEVGRKIPEAWYEIVRSTIAAGQSREVELKIGFMTYLLIIVPVLGMGYANIFGLDVTASKQIERKLKQDAQVFENASEAIMILDTEMRILDVNLAFEAITGYSREEVLGEEATVLKTGGENESLRLMMWKSIEEKGSWQGEIWDRRKNGEGYPEWIAISSILDENETVTRYIALLSDISTLKQAQERLYYLAHYDSLTGLANRRQFLDRLAQSIEDAKRTKEQLAVLFIDLDGFKQINDTYGHSAGDQFLRETAARIKSSLRQSDVVARMGGDEFTAILPHIRTNQDAAFTVQKMLKTMAEPLIIADRELLMSISVGISIYPDDAPDVEGLLQFADTALYQAKDLGKNGYQFYSPEMNLRAAEVLTLKAKMRKGIELDEFILYYQPQVEVLSGRIRAVEGLCRWNSHELGLIGPDRFIPLAEETGMIHDIGSRMLSLACRQGRLWREAGIGDLRIAVNLSSVQLKRSDFASIAEATIQELGMPPGGLEFEITESVLLNDDEVVITQLKRLKAMGASLAIDDFGTKYSSLSYLRWLPIDRLKIDISFVKALPKDPGSVALASAIIAMGHSLGLEVVAEGVESTGQANLLAGKACDALQGELFSAPLPPDRLKDLVIRGWERDELMAGTTAGEG